MFTIAQYWMTSSILRNRTVFGSPCITCTVCKTYSGARNYQVIDNRLIFVFNCRCCSIGKDIIQPYLNNNVSSINCHLNTTPIRVRQCFCFTDGNACTTKQCFGRRLNISLYASCCAYASNASFRCQYFTMQIMVTSFVFHSIFAHTWFTFAVVCCITRYVIMMLTTCSKRINTIGTIISIRITCVNIRTKWMSIHNANLTSTIRFMVRYHVLTLSGRTSCVRSTTFNTMLTIRYQRIISVAFHAIWSC